MEPEARIGQPKGEKLDTVEERIGVSQSEVEQLHIQIAVLTELLETYESSMSEQSDALEKALEESQQRADRLEATVLKLRKAQSRLIQTEKMSSLGQLAAGVAHEIKNPIGFIFGNITHIDQCFEDVFELIDLYRYHYPLPAAPIRDKIEEIDVELLKTEVPQILSSVRNGSVRVRKIVDSLQNFARLNEAQQKYANVHQGLDNTLVFLRNRLQASSAPLRPKIQVAKRYGNLPQIKCYPGDLNQVFVNLLANAIDAIDAVETWAATGADDGGKSTDRWRADVPQIEIETEQIDAKRIRICFRNNGIDLPEDSRNYLFDPFFTTKDVGRGTGLGLSVCYQVVVERHYGDITCRSLPGQRGAEFAIELPVA